MTKKQKLGALEAEFQGFVENCFASGLTAEQIEQRREVWYTGAYATFWLITGYIDAGEEDPRGFLLNMTALNTELKAYSADLKLRAAAAKKAEQGAV